MILDPRVFLGGLFLGSLYGTAAVGFQLILGATGRVHLAFGHLWIVWALAFSSVTAQGTVGPVAVLTAMTACGWAAGWVFHPGRLFRERLTGERARSFFLVTLGAALILEHAGGRFWPLPGTALAWAPAPLFLGRLAVPPAKLGLLASGLCLAVGFQLYLRKSRWGRAFVAWDLGREPVWLAGVDTAALGRRAVALGVAVSALAGGFLALSYTVSIQEGMAMTIRLLVLAVLGGTLSPLGVLGAGMGLGVGEALLGQVLGLRWSPALGYVLLLVILPVMGRRRAW